MQPERFDTTNKNYKVMKKISYFILAAVTVVLAACGDGNDPEKTGFDKFFIRAYDITTTSFTFDILAKDPTMEHADCYLTPSDFIDENGKKLSLTVEEALKRVAEKHEWSYSDYTNTWKSTGDNIGVWYSELEPETEYVVCVFSMTEDNEVTLLAYEKVTTLAPWVDLGLPSGTIWASDNEAYTSFEWAANHHLENIPTIDQWQELFAECTFKWNPGTENIRPYATLTSKHNGKTITLSVNGYVECDDYTYKPQDRTTGYYWSQTADMESVQCALISSSGFRTSGWPKCLTMCLRLVKKSKDK